MEFNLATSELLDEKVGSHLLSLMSQILEDNGYHIHYMEFNEIDNHQIGDSSLTEETFFKSTITRRPLARKKKVLTCADGICPVD